MALPATRPRSAGAGHTPDRRIATALLGWYGAKRRLLPWRAEPGHLQEPWKAWVAEAMLQQVCVAAVLPLYDGFLHRFPTPASLAAVEIEEALRYWNGLGRYARIHNLHAASRAVATGHGGAVPRDAASLLALPGVGPYTAAAIRAMAFGEPDPPMDANLDRVLARLFMVRDALPAARPILARRARRLMRTAEAQGRPGDLAQAVMDLGASLCRPRAPLCTDCPLRDECRALQRGAQDAVPVLPPRPVRRLRYAAAFRLSRSTDGAVLLRRRPAKGPLAGTLDLPATPWGDRPVRRDRALPSAPLDAAWRRVPGEVRHALSGADVRVVVFEARVETAEACGTWLRPADLAGEALAGLARKLLAHGGRAGTRPGGAGQAIVPPVGEEGSAA